MLSSGNLGIGSSYPSGYPVFIVRVRSNDAKLRRIIESNATSLKANTSSAPMPVPPERKPFTSIAMPPFYVLAIVSMLSRTPPLAITVQPAEATLRLLSEQVPLLSRP